MFAIFSSRFIARSIRVSRRRNATLVGRLTSAYSYIVWMAHRPVITLQNLRRHKLRPVCRRPGEQRHTLTLTAVFTLQINSDSYREYLSSHSLSRFIFLFFFSLSFSLSLSLTHTQSFLLAMQTWMSVNGTFLRSFIRDRSFARAINLNNSFDYEH